MALTGLPPEVTVVPIEPPRPARHFGVVTAARRAPRAEVGGFLRALHAAAGLASVPASGLPADEGQ